MTKPQIDGQWLDFYALLEVPVNADEDAIRKRIGKVYAEASAHSDHRELSKRNYYRSLVERVLPQCRRVLLDPQWRAKYDRQHILHSIGDPSAQDYVSFIASMRGGDIVLTGDALLPQRVQEEISAAKAVVETANAGAELELLPAKTLSSKAEAARENENDLNAARIQEAPVHKPVAQPAFAKPAEPAVPPANVSVAPETPEERPDTPYITVQKTKKQVENITQEGEPVRAKVITAQEAANIRRQRSSNPDTGHMAAPIYDTPPAKRKEGPGSRVVVGQEKRPQRLISSTSLNLMVAITGVLLTITIQRFAATPAVATSQGRVPIFVSAAPQIADALAQNEVDFERSPEGADFDLVIQSVDGDTAVRRALGKSGDMPDVWIPSNSIWVERYNGLAPKSKRPNLESSTSVAQTPMVLIARSDRSSALRSKFSDHRISSWQALRQAVIANAAGHFGLPDPEKSATGAMARFSMAREWATTNGVSPQEASKSRAFWSWMNGFEENTPTNASSVNAMIKDLALGTTGRYWWAIAYESDALEWINKGNNLEVFYLPRTSLADHPFVEVERTGAPLEVARGRTAYNKFLHSSNVQKSLLKTGFRPTEISPSTKIAGNPFLNADVKSRGARIEGLPRDERPSFRTIDSIEREWSKRYE